MLNGKDWLDYNEDGTHNPAKQCAADTTYLEVRILAAHDCPHRRTLRNSTWTMPGYCSIVVGFPPTMRLAWVEQAAAEKEVTMILAKLVIKIEGLVKPISTLANSSALTLMNTRLMEQSAKTKPKQLTCYQQEHTSQLHVFFFLMTKLKK